MDFRTLMLLRDAHILKHRLPVTVPWPKNAPPLVLPDEDDDE